MQQENKRVFSCFLNDLASFCMCVCRTVDVCVCMHVRMYVDPMQAIFAYLFIEYASIHLKQVTLRFKEFNFDTVI